MLNCEELKSLLERGRVLEEEINIFIKAPTTSSSHRLVIRINELISDIRPKLLNPSSTEDDEIGLVIANLGKIMKNLTNIKHTLKTH